jgi:hypothetical protein
MERLTVINRALRDLKMFGLIDPDYVGEVRPFLNAVYIAGWEKGRSNRGHRIAKRIGQYTEDKELFQTFRSLADAAKMTGFSQRAIYKSMELKRPMKQGWTWKYLDMNRAEHYANVGPF